MCRNNIINSRRQAKGKLGHVVQIRVWRDVNVMLNLSNIMYS